MTSGTEAAATASSTSRLALSINPELLSTSVYEVNPLSDSRWDVLVMNHPRASVFHATNWLRALQATYGYDPLVVTTCSPGADLTNGLVFCRVKSWLTGRRIVSLPFADHCEPLVSNSTEFDDLLLHMTQYVDSGEARYIEIRPTACRPGSQTPLTKGAEY